jgi:hypothetical protein
VVARVPHRDAEQERAQRGLSAEARDDARQREERLLQKVLGGLVVADEASREGTDVRVVGVVDLAEGSQLAGAEPRDELFLPARRLLLHESQRQSARPHVTRSLGNGARGSEECSLRRAEPVEM